MVSAHGGGLWRLHAPVLQNMPAAAEDAALLKGCRKQRWWPPGAVDVRRLALASGYGAGIESPGWYHHLWQTARRDSPPRRWRFNG